VYILSYVPIFYMMSCFREVRLVIHSSCGLLGYDAVWWCGRIPVFRRILLPPSSPWRWRQQDPPITSLCCGCFWEVCWD